MSERPGVRAFFARKNIFITGASGFLGKVLVEKLLRSCPDVGNIYVLTRPKKGMDMRTRWKKIAELELYDKLKAQNPKALDRIIPVAGDVTQKELGLSEQDRNVLINNVNIIYHVAATVRFDQPLKEAIIMNTRATRDMCMLALEMKNIEVFMHVSTAYCHTKNNKVIEEKLYPPYADWRKLIEMAETLSSETMEERQSSIMADFPNTYTFTKSMGENLVNELLESKVKNIIIRPSIVISTHNDPISGWIDNFYGPVGLLVACGSGLVRINLLAEDVKADFVPVDFVIKAMLVATWYQGTEKCKSLGTVVYNCSSNGIKSVTIKEIMNMATDVAWEYPLATAVWYPSTTTTTSVTIYYVYAILFHIIPAIILDGLIMLAGHKPQILKIQKRVFNATMALKYYMCNEWKIENTSLYSLEKNLPSAEEADFAYKVESVDIKDYYKKACMGAKKWLLKEDLNNLDGIKFRFKIFYCMDWAVKIFFYLALFYLFFVKLELFNSMSSYWSIL